MKGQADNLFTTNLNLMKTWVSGRHTGEASTTVPIPGKLLVCSMASGQESH